MPTYFVESHATGSIVEDQRIRAQRAAQLVSSVRYIRTTFLPDDETLLHLFEATSRDELVRAAMGAGLDFDRIVDAIESRPGVAVGAIDRIGRSG
jgi:hypothetical protein